MDREWQTYREMDELAFKIKCWAARKDSHATCKKDGKFYMWCFFSGSVTADKFYHIITIELVPVPYTIVDERLHSAGYIHPFFLHILAWLQGRVVSAIQRILTVDGTLKTGKTTLLASL